MNLPARSHGFSGLQHTDTKVSVYASKVSVGPCNTHAVAIGCSHALQNCFVRQQLALGLNLWCDCRCVFTVVPVIISGVLGSNEACLSLQAIQKQSLVQDAIPSNLPLPEDSLPNESDAHQSEQSSASEHRELSEVTTAKSFQAGVLSAAKRLALTYRSQKKLLLWDVVLSL